jgi:hypothetical protein
MTKTKKLLAIAVGLCLSMIFGVSTALGGSIQKPVIFSYYWPIGEGQKNLLNWNMDSPTIIDIPWQDSPEWLEAKVYWEKREKTVLYRVYPFRGIKTEDEMHDRFYKNLENSKGIAIDEIVTHSLSKKQAEMFINVLRKVRHAYPDRIIAVWCSGDWNEENSFVLEAIRDYADMFLPELYISQKAAESKGLGEFKHYLKAVEDLVPRITEKTVMGLGMHPMMADDPSQSFRDHLSSQIVLLGTDPFFKSLFGIALYAPVYLPADDQKWIDSLIKKHFSR